MGHTYDIVTKQGARLTASTEIDLARKYAAADVGAVLWQVMTRWERSTEIGAALSVVRSDRAKGALLQATV